MRKLILISFFSRFGTAILNFIVIILLSRYLGPAGKGVATRLLVIVSAIQILCDFMGGAALVFLSSRNTLKSLLVPVWIWSLLCSAAASVVVWRFQPAIFEVYGVHLTILAFLSATFNQHLHMLSGREQFSSVNILNIGQSFCIALCLGIFISFNRTPEVYALALYFGWGLPFLFSLFFLNNLSKKPFLERKPSNGKLPGKGVFSDMRWLLSYCVTNQLAHLLQFANQRLTFFLLPVVSLGIYSNSVSLAESIWMVGSSIALVQYGKIANSEEKSNSVAMTTQLFRATLILSVCAGILLLLTPSWVFVFFFGKGFEAVKESLILLLPGILCMSGYLIIGHYFSGTGQFRKNNQAIFVGLLVTVICFAALYGSGIYELSSHEAAVITSCSQAATFFSVIWLFKIDSRIAISDLIPGLRDLTHFLRLVGLKRD